MHSEKKPIYLCRNSKEAFKLSQYFSSPDTILTLHDFIDGLYKKHPNIKMPYRVLNGIEEKLLWEKSIKHYKKTTFDLSQIESLSEVASQANRIIDQFNISENTLKSEERNEEHTFFNAWRFIFKKYCHDKHAITFHAFIKEVITHIENREILIDHPLCLVGFEILNPLETLLVEACKKQTDVSLFKNKVIQPSIEARAFINEEHECAEVVEWCEAQIATHKKILIVTPQLDHIIDRLSSLLDKTFHPETFNPEYTQQKRIYQFSLNSPLFYYPEIFLNIKLIDLAARGLLNKHELKNILSHHSWSDPQELFQRYRLIGVLEKKQRKSTSIHDLLEVFETIEDLTHLAPLFKKHLTYIHTSHQNWQLKKMPSAWVATFDIYLKEIQSSLFNPKNPFEVRLFESWTKINEKITTLDSLLGELSVEDMLETLEYYLKKNTLPQDAPGEFKIEILGFHETTFETYDAAWIMNLNEHLWPQKITFNPFLPIKIQQNLHINTYEKLSAEAQQILEKFSQKAPHVVLSYAKQLGEEVLFPSPSLVALSSSKPLEDTNYKFKKNKHNQYDIEYIEDNTSIKINGQKQLKSGIKLLDAQSICPAWAFFEFRLGASSFEDKDEENLTARLRGNLFHKVLEEFWMEHKSPSLISHLETESLRKKIEALTHKAVLIEMKNYPKILPEFFLIEEIRLVNYLENWVLFELNREPFEVKETEKHVSIQLSHLNFNIKIDRIDKVYQQTIVIDYKSGSPKNLKEWFLSASGELQMPFYALFAARDPADAIAIGLINDDKPQWLGIGRDTNILQGIKDHTSSPFDSWDDLLNFWRGRIDEAVKDYEKGNAAVIFSSEKDLTYCRVKPILRLPERLLQFERNQL